jgi:hypothetical protein
MLNCYSHLDLIFKGKDSLLRSRRHVIIKRKAKEIAGIIKVVLKIGNFRS